MIIQILLLIIGFIILIKGADIFVDGASNIAHNYKIPKMIIGLTIVAFGSSAPDFAISIKSMLNGSREILLGNVIGSNIMNILLIVGICSLIHNLKVSGNTVKKEIPFAMLMTLLLTVVMNDKIFNNTENIITRSDGIIILLFFTIFIHYLFSLISAKQYKEKGEAKHNLKKSIIYTIIGIILIILGSHFTIESACKIAENLNISERIISLTIISLFSTLPELITSVIATKKGEYDIAIGNVVGSNIFNIGMVLGLPIVIFGNIPVTFKWFDMVTLLLSIILLFLYTRKDKEVGKKEGISLLIIFVIYYILVII